MSAPLELLRTDLAALREPMRGIVTRLADDDPSLAAAFAERAGARGHEDPLGTLAAQAGVLALMAAIRLELAGASGADTLAGGGPAAVASATTDARYRGDIAWQLVAACTTPVPANGVAAVARAMRTEATRDLIGDIYQEAVSQSERRQLGQFWTPEPIARLMAAWAIRRPGDRVLDPAAGAGALVLPALGRLEALGADPRTLGDGQFQTNDIDALVMAILITNLAAHGDGAHPGVELADALTTRAGESFDAIIANPPYTRHHHLPEAYKALLRERIAGARGVRLSGFTSLFGYFYLECLSLLADGGRMAFITPAELLDASYAKPIKAHLLEAVNLRAVIFFGDAIDAFPGVDTAGTITLTEAGECDGAGIAFLELSAWPGPEAVLDAIAGGRPADLPWGTLRIRSRSELARAGKWVVPAAHRAVHHAGMVPLGGAGGIGRVMRGIATGNNDYFTLTESQRRELGIEERYLRPVLIKTRDWMALAADHDRLEAVRAEGRKGWLFYCHEDREALGGSRALDYIHAGEAAGVPATKLISLRPVWFALERREPPDAIYTYLSRGWPRFIRNDLGALNLNGFHSVYFPEQIRDDHVLRDAFMAILNSGLVLGNLRSVGRSYGGGTVKVEPSELASLPVFDPRRLPDAAARELAELFRSGSALAPVAFDPVRAEIDRVLEAASRTAS